MHDWHLHAWFWTGEPNLSFSWGGSVVWNFCSHISYIGCPRRMKSSTMPHCHLQMGIFLGWEESIIFCEIIVNLNGWRMQYCISLCQRDSKCCIHIVSVPLSDILIKDDLIVYVMVWWRMWDTLLNTAPMIIILLLNA